MTPRLKKGLMTSAIVGTLLTLINQYHGIFGNDDMNWLSMFLTYMVPFGVHWNSSRIKSIEPSAQLEK